MIVKQSSKSKKIDLDNENENNVLNEKKYCNPLSNQNENILNSSDIIRR